MLILGSSSPRRKEILSYFSIPFRVESPDFDELSHPFTGDPQEYVLSLAKGKAASLHHRFPEDTIVCADTVVYIDNQVLNKAQDEAEMKHMLQLLSGRRHSVFTGVYVAAPHKTCEQVEETQVVCNRLTPEEIHLYMRGHHLYDKAGAYAIQRSGSMLIKEIHGCYYNTMGLPVNTLTQLLQQVGINLWHHLQPF